MISIEGYFLKCQRFRIKDFGAITLTTMGELTEYQAVDRYGNPFRLEDDIVLLMSILFT